MASRRHRVGKSKRHRTKRRRVASGYTPAERRRLNRATKATYMKVLAEVNEARARRTNELRTAIADWFDRVRGR